MAARQLISDQQELQIFNQVVLDHLAELPNWEEDRLTRLIHRTRISSNPLRFGDSFLSLLICGSPQATVMEPLGSQICVLSLADDADFMQLAQESLCTILDRFPFLKECLARVLVRLHSSLLSGSATGVRKTVVDFVAWCLWTCCVQPDILVQLKDQDFVLDILARMASHRSDLSVVQVMKKSGLLDIWEPTEQRLRHTLEQRNLTCVVSCLNSRRIADAQSLLRKTTTQAIQAGSHPDVIRCDQSILISALNSDEPLPEEPLMQSVLEGVITALAGQAWVSQEVGWHKHHQIREFMKQHLCLLSGFLSKNTAKVALLNTLQKLCFCNERLFGHFSSIVWPLIKTSCIDKEALKIWFDEDHDKTAWTFFQTQFKSLLDRVMERSSSSDLNNELHPLIRKTHLHAVLQVLNAIPDASPATDDVVEQLSQFYLSNHAEFISDLEHGILSRINDPDHSWSIYLCKTAGRHRLLFSWAFRLFHTYLLQSRAHPAIVDSFQSFVGQVQDASPLPAFQLYPDRMQHLIALLQMSHVLPKDHLKEQFAQLEQTSPEHAQLLQCLYPELLPEPIGSCGT